MLDCLLVYLSKCLSDCVWSLASVFVLVCLRVFVDVGLSARMIIRGACLAGCVSSQPRKNAGHQTLCDGSWLAYELVGFPFYPAALSEMCRA